MEQNENIGPISTKMRILTQRDGDLSTFFDISVESEGGIIISSLKQKLNINYTTDNRVVIRGPLPLNT